VKRDTPGRHSETEVMGLALVLAICVHAVVITQVSFRGLDVRRDDRAPSLDVILVDAASESAPDQADFLAQANQVGGGDNDSNERPSAPPPAEPSGQPRRDDAPAERAPPEPSAEAPARPVVSTDEALADLTRAETPEPEPRELPDPAELLRQARQTVETAPDPLAYERVLPKRPRRKFVTANTREHLYASYMRAWVAKVERVGNMNYPERARRRNLDGSLVLSVDVLPDGSIERVQVLRSSGYELLDEAAVRIVRLAAPYAELPPDIRAETDILTITRTWQFSARRGLN